MLDSVYLGYRGIRLAQGRPAGSSLLGEYACQSAGLEIPISVDFFRRIAHPVHGERAEARFQPSVLDRIHVSRIWRIPSNQLLNEVRVIKF